jgi:hypothetical protein
MNIEQFTRDMNALFGKDTWLYQITVMSVFEKGVTAVVVRTDHKTVQIFVGRAEEDSVIWEARSSQGEGLFGPSRFALSCHQALLHVIKDELC